MFKHSIFAKTILGGSICLLIAACGSASITCTATVSTESKVKSIVQNGSAGLGFGAIASDNAPASVVNISGTLEASGLSGLMAKSAYGTSASSLPDVGVFEMDVSGSSVVWPQQGNVTLTIFNKGTGGSISVRSFAWTRSGSRIQFSNPAEVNNWVVSTGATADTAKVKYDMGAVEVGSAIGDNIVSTAVLQDNVVRARGTTQWTIYET